MANLFEQNQIKIGVSKWFKMQKKKLNRLHYFKDTYRVFLVALLIRVLMSFYIFIKKI